MTNQKIVQKVKKELHKRQLYSSEYDSSGNVIEHFYPEVALKFAVAEARKQTAEEILQKVKKRQSEIDAMLSEKGSLLNPLHADQQLARIGELEWIIRWLPKKGGGD